MYRHWPGDYLHVLHLHCLRIVEGLCTYVPFLYICSVLVENKIDEIADVCIGSPHKASTVLKCGSGGGKLIVCTNDIGR